MMAIFRKQGFIAGKFGAFFERVIGIFGLGKTPLGCSGSCAKFAVWKKLHRVFSSLRLQPQCGLKQLQADC
jgi:hypothetical protein